METTELKRSRDLLQRIEQFREAYQAHDVDRLVSMFAAEATYTAAPGTFRGREAIRRFLSWDASLSPRAVIRDTGVGVLVSGSTVTWEREFELSAEGVPYREQSLAVIEFDDTGLIRHVRSYYDKLAVLDQIAQGLRGPSGWVFRGLTGYLVRMGTKGLPPSEA
jgi:ketosteroid isomerase-like protein